MTLLWDYCYYYYYLFCPRMGVANRRSTVCRRRKLYGISIVTEKQNIHRVPEFYYDKKLSLKNVLGLSMARSDSKIYTTWSNLKHCSANNVMTRHPSGNNNTIPNFLQATGQLNLNLNKRSQSLPDLTQTRELTRYPLNFSVSTMT